MVYSSKLGVLRVFEHARLHYTEVYRIPTAATFSDGIWTYNDGLRHKGGNREYCLTIVLPPRAELVSTEPTAAVDTADGRTLVRFHGTAMDDVQYVFAVRYKLASPSKEEWKAGLKQVSGGSG